MANTATTGTTAAASPAFNFCNVQRLMHSVVYERSTVTADAVSRDDYHQLADALQTVENAAQLCQQTSEGLSLLVDMMATYRDMPQHIAQALHGLLLPMATSLERTGAALQGSMAKPTKED